MERVYSVNAHPKIREAIIKFGKEKARGMGINFHGEKSLEDSEEVVTRGKIVLYSKGSRSAFTYTDSGGGRAANGVFDVELYD